MRCTLVLLGRIASITTSDPGPSPSVLGGRALRRTDRYDSVRSPAAGARIWASLARLTTKRCDQVVLGCISKIGFYCTRLQSPLVFVLGHNGPQRPYRAASGPFCPASSPSDFSLGLATKLFLRCTLEVVGTSVVSLVEIVECGLGWWSCGVNGGRCGSKTKGCRSPVALAMRSCFGMGRDAPQGFPIASAARSGSGSRCTIDGL